MNLTQNSVEPETTIKKKARKREQATKSKSKSDGNEAIRSPNTLGGDKIHLLLQELQPIESMDLTQNSVEAKTATKKKPRKRKQVTKSQSNIDDDLMIQGMISSTTGHKNH